MTHDFSTLTSVLGRCSAKVADKVIAEIRTAINDAVIQRNNSPAANLTKVSAAVHQKKAEQAAARRAKAAARKAQKAAEKEVAAEKEAATDSAERSESPRCGSVAKRQLSGAEAPDARLGSCGEAEAELPANLASSTTSNRPPPNKPPPSSSTTRPSPFPAPNAAPSNASAASNSAATPHPFKLQES